MRTVIMSIKLMKIEKKRLTRYKKYYIVEDDNNYRQTKISTPEEIETVSLDEVI